MITYFLQGNAILNTLIYFVSAAFYTWINSILWQVEIMDIKATLNSILQVSVMDC